MDPSVGSSDFDIPSASLSIFDTLSVIFWVPVYDRIIVPFARRFTGHKNGLTQLQRMGIGLFISIFAMISAAALELVRLRIVRKHNYYELEHMPLSIFWQVPQYFLIGCAEVFVFIGQLEFFYEQAPDAMRSLCSALSLTTVALGNYLSSLLVTIVTKVEPKAKNHWPTLVESNPVTPATSTLQVAVSVISMIRKRYQDAKTGFQLVKSMNTQKFLKKIGLGKEDYYFWKQVGKALLATYTLFGVAWLYNETSPLGWWTLKPRPKEERELAHLYDRREFPYPGDEEAMEEFVARGGMIGTTIGPKGTIETDKDAFNYQKDLQNKKLEQEALKLWFRMRNEVIQELQEKGFDVE
ncbi:Protein NRT1/ PTR FAMILY 8.2 [Morella rubra]|uniref:Protein NRT1/ PTR FAMILY 8.2 n=1 Tax=Morella rubra TaxID=262757 RepID=A0A6A1WKL8_9ROSI|nr:Protein NRT1/ PTR FAMILY 8.2 [Morella rubra]